MKNIKSKKIVQLWAEAGLINTFFMEDENPQQLSLEVDLALYGKMQELAIEMIEEHFNASLSFNGNFETVGDIIKFL